MTGAAFSLQCSAVSIRRVFAHLVLLSTLAYGVCLRVTLTPAICAPVPDCEESRSCRRCPNAPPTREAPSPSPCKTCEQGFLALASETDRRPEPTSHDERPALAQNLQSTIPAFEAAAFNRRIDVRSASPPLHLLDATFRT